MKTNTIYIILIIIVGIYLYRLLNKNKQNVTEHLGGTTTGGTTTGGTTTGGTTTGGTTTGGTTTGGTTTGGTAAVGTTTGGTTTGGTTTGGTTTGGTAAVGTTTGGTTTGGTTAVGTNAVNTNAVGTTAVTTTPSTIKKTLLTSPVSDLKQYNVIEDKLYSTSIRPDNDVIEGEQYNTHALKHVNKNTLFTAHDTVEEFSSFIKKNNNDNGYPTSFMTPTIKSKVKPSNFIM